MILGLSAVCAGPAPAAIYTWTPTAAGTFNWDDASSNWSAGFPDATGDVANIVQDFSGAQAINLNQAITVGSLTFNDTGASGDSAVTLAAGTAGSLVFQASSGNATLTNSSVATNVISAPVTFNSNTTINSGVGAATGINLSGGFSGSGNITKTGSNSTLTLGGSNSGFTGNWILSGGATTSVLSISSDANLGAVPVSASTNISSNNNNVLLFTSALTLNANRNISTAASSSLTLNANSGVTATVAGNIGGAGGITRNTSSLTSVVVLSGTNSYTGATTVSGGVLRAGSTSAFGTNSAVTIANVSYSRLDLNGFSNSIGSLSGAIAGTNGQITLGSGTLTTGGLNTSTSYTGIISGTGGFTKVGSGTQTLGGANTYTGATTVSAGTLALSSTGSLAAGSALSIADGAVFDVTAQSSYALGTGGTTIGIGSGTAGFFNAGSAAMTFGNALTLNFSSPTLAASYDLFDFGSQSGNLGSIALTGSITGSLLLTSADTWTGSAGDYDFSFSEVSGILSVASASIPEPSTYALFLAGLTLAGTALRRRR